MSNRKGLRGIAALYVGHMAGTIDLAALPLWIGVLMAHYGLAPEQAGLTVTLFLGGIVVMSTILAPRFDRLSPRWIAFAGFCAAALCFSWAWGLPVAPSSFGKLLAIHGIAGLCVGSALSMVHGSIGRTENPHRHFGLANVMVGVLAVLMFAFIPGEIAAYGGQVVIMAIGAGAIALFFPEQTTQGEDAADEAGVEAKSGAGRVPLIAYLTIAAVVCLMLNQSMVFAFIERIAATRGFDASQVQILLVLLGFINLMPGVLAVLLQRRLPALAVGIAGALTQAALALTLTNATVFNAFAAPTLFYASIVLFTHTFLFGVLSRLDPSGRAVAATPAMMMTGAALGPALGGAIVAIIGFEGLGLATFCFSAIAAALLMAVKRNLSRRKHDLVATLPAHSS
ncbi:MFS transporter [Agrobacterium sp. fls2-241-TYG-188a]|uniref:MFS transporter n=1 Tax=Agrobacterium sp. fls2-241-TYG-188a TaxID=3040275 RepID=UPI002549FD75|nr:MFS transporter [Agrobacterium sp. fls2-241-TYG-188a]